jgi:polysaccharide pyruvyl transferase WcaK-like protein
MMLKQAHHYVMIGDIGGIDEYHVGDEAMLEANLIMLRLLMPGVSFTLVSKDPDWSSQHYTEKAIGYIGFPAAYEGTNADRSALLSELVSNAERWRRGENLTSEDTGFRTIEAIARSDGVIISGGGNLCSSWPDHIYERVALSRVARILQKPVFVLGQTIGPRLDPQERDLLASELAYATLIGVREADSRSVVTSLGVENDRILCQLDDAVFLAPPTDPHPVQRLLSGFDKPWIAVTLHPFIDPTENPEATNSLVRQLTAIVEATGSQLVFIPHVDDLHREHLSDAAFGKRLAELLRPQVDMLVLEVPNAREARFLISQASMVVSTRYHPIVFGLSWGVPCFGIFADKYTRIKLQGALAHAGLSSWSLPASLALVEDMLVDGVLEVWSSRKIIREHMSTILARWRKEYIDHWLRIYRTLTSDDGSTTELRKAVSSTITPEERLSDAAASSASLRPTGSWAQVSRILEPIIEQYQERITNLETDLSTQHRDFAAHHQAWAHERREIIRQRDTAVHYAKSLEAALRSREGET